MEDDWQTFEFGDLLINGTRNGVYKKKGFHGSGVKIVNMGELFAYPRLYDIPMKRVELTEEELDKSSLECGDLLFARRSLVAEGAGKCSIVMEVNEPTTFESSIIRARPNPAKANSLFLYYFFDSPQGRYLLSTIVRQVAVAGITGSDLVRLCVPLPPLEVQEAIACIVGALDEKIELNQRMNETLEGIARAIFKSWFVDFNPVRAKAAGQQPPGLAPHIADLFPDTFEESELGEIPEGWNVASVGDVCEFAYGKALKASIRKPGEVPVMGSNGQIGWHDTALVAEPGIVVGRKGNPGVVTWVNSGFFPIDTTFYIVSRLPSVPLSYLNFALIGLDLPRLSADSAVPGLNRNIAYMSRLLLPPREILKVFAHHTRLIMDRVNQGEQENRTLVALRDTLLPKLISGELRVPEAERFLEANGCSY